MNAIREWSILLYNFRDGALWGTTGYRSGHWSVWLPSETEERVIRDEEVMDTL